MHTWLAWWSWITFTASSNNLGWKLKLLSGVKCSRADSFSLMWWGIEISAWEPNTEKKKGVLFVTSQQQLIFLDTVFILLWIIHRLYTVFSRASWVSGDVFAGRTHGCWVICWCTHTRKDVVSEEHKQNILCTSTVLLWSWSFRGAYLKASSHQIITVFRKVRK